MRITPVILFLATTTLISCIKKGLPEPVPEELVTTPVKNGIEHLRTNGYFLARLDNYNLINDNYNAAFFFCCFNDPEDVLLSSYWRHMASIKIPSSNVAVGNVSFANYELMQLGSGSNVYYSKNLNNIIMPDLLQWYTEGRSTFTGIRQVVERGFPEIEHPEDPYTVNPDKGFTIRFSGKFENCDSVGIEIFHYPNNIYKAALRSSDSITFSPKELRVLRNQNGVMIYFWTSNFSSQTVNNKKYVYELMRREQTLLNIDTLL